MERFTTLIRPAELRASLDAPELVIVDCRASLADADAGRASYMSGHLPSARFADLLRELSGPIEPGKTGRHPLPQPEAFVNRLRAWGVKRTSQVVVYDDAGGAFAARLWWMLRWLGHERAAVLDGGLSAWLAEAGPMSAELPTATRGDFTPSLRPELLVDAASVAELASSQQAPLLDARAPERFRGEVEPIDALAGHIPGAVNLPFADNLEQGRFRSPEALRARFEAALGGVSAADSVVYCGSGVTACHAILAAAHAGLALPRLYAGSWSEWITDVSRPVARG